MWANQDKWIDVKKNQDLNRIFMCMVKSENQHNAIIDSFMGTFYQLFCCHV